MDDISEEPYDSPDKKSYEERSSFSSSPKRQSRAFTKKVTDNSVLEQSFRSSKLAKERENARNQMLQECSFEPNIKPLPRSYGPNKTAGTLVYNRLTKWEKNREVDIKQKKVLRAHEEVKHCTFKPQINKHSSKQQAKDKHATVRLYEESALIAQNKARLAEELRSKEIEKETKECTFKPQLSTRRTAWAKVEPKYNQPIEASVDDSTLDKENYTYKPQVNRVSSEMISASVYCNQDVTDRLTQFAKASPQKKQIPPVHKDRTIIDVNSFLTGSFGVTNDVDDSVCDEEGKADVCTPSKNDKDNVSRPYISVVEKERRKKQFNAFLARQQAAEERKKIQMKELKRSLSHQRQFEVNEESKRIISKTQKGEFLERLQLDVKLRTERKNEQPATPEDFTFKPALHKPSTIHSHDEGTKRKQIIATSETAQSVRKDENKSIHRQHQVQRKGQRDVDRREPSASNKMNKTKSKIVIDPDAHFQRQEKLLEKKKIQKEKVLAEREAKEMAECTFAPEIKECPKFVTNIARSISVVKSVRMSHLVPAKDDWK